MVERVDRQCRTVQDSSQSSRVVAYNVTYRNPDGTTGSMRTDSKPGNRILLGDEERTVGYDVTYVYDGSERTIRMDERPDERLPVINGRIMTAALGTPTAERHRNPQYQQKTQRNARPPKKAGSHQREACFTVAPQRRGGTEETARHFPKMPGLARASRASR